MASNIRSEISFRSSATVANFGGYDVGGFALEEPRNHYYFQLLGKLDLGLFDRRRAITLFGGTYGDQLRELPQNPDHPNSELVNTTLHIAMGEFELRGPYLVAVSQAYPLRKGGGMSATARTAPYFALNEIHGLGLSRYDIAKKAVHSEIKGRKEGHWDNIAPNVLGGYVFIVPEGEDAELLRYEPINGHAVLLFVPPWEKQSTNVLRPPVQAFTTDYRGLERALYATSMIVGAAARSAFLTLPEGRRLDVVNQFMKGAPETVKMSDITGRQVAILRHVAKEYPKADIPAQQLVRTVGEYSAHEGTHTLARAQVKGFAPNERFSDWEAYSDEMILLGGYPAKNGAGPSYVTHLDETLVPPENIDRMVAIGRDYIRSVGNLSEEESKRITVLKTRPSSKGLERVAHYTDGREAVTSIEVSLAMLEQLVSTKVVA
ncbi:MAG: hypothetical protein HY361_02890 [Candidatus Aenigmarchaeota archaeon]|nr:hypothetical protein [Candidatus Aenigmarchaeota archaeon]